MAIDISLLPAPEAIETIDTEAIISALVADVTARLNAAGIAYDVGGLEADPVKIVLEAAAARETNLRARVNDAVKSNLVAYAAGANLDHLAAFYDVTRLDGETDAALRERVILTISGRSTAGPTDWYRAAARRASVRVKDARVYRVGTGPELRLSVLATDNFGEPDAALLEAVDLVIQSDSVRVISDRITVVPATSVTVNVAAEVWLLPTTPQSVFAGLEAALRNALAAEGGLGFDVTPSWIVSKLHQQGGVQKVVLTSPMSGAVVDENSAAKFGTITLTYMGRAH